MCVCVFTCACPCENIFSLRRYAIFCSYSIPTELPFSLCLVSFSFIYFQCSFISSMECVGKVRACFSQHVTSVCVVAVHVDAVCAQDERLQTTKMAQRKISFRV